MQTMLIAVTLASAAVAVTMCAVVIRMLREERRRSDARVEVLVAMAGAASAATPQNEDRHRSLLGPDVLEGERPAPSARERGAALPASREHDDYEPVLNSTASVSGVDGLFAERATPSAWGRRIGVAAVCAAFVTLGILAIGSQESDVEAPGTTVGREAIAPTPLELLSLRHTARPKALTITGLVQNPRSGQVVTGVTAVALLFGSDGSFLGSGRAPLDFTALRPGDESPFVVDVSANGVARYRVSFRNSDGEVLAHVDRRGAGALAQKD